MDTGETLVARSCGFDSKEETVCGIFVLGGNESSEDGGRMRSLQGCIDTCAGPDGCNGGATTTIMLQGMVVLVICLFIPLKIV